MSWDMSGTCPAPAAYDRRTRKDTTLSISDLTDRIRAKFAEADAIAANRRFALLRLDDFLRLLGEARD
ncbi:MAG TPA: hypothetical protein VFA70_04895 [Dehalococcoidia bacterium]|jgi:hypothetical protein|nr:hypothetical protein [Dehalococcoidia bacterium]